MLYAASLIGLKDGRVNHTACMVEANNHDEAIGKAARVGHKVYPASEGYTLHVQVNTQTTPSDPDGVITRTPAEGSRP